MQDTMTKAPTGRKFTPRKLDALKHWAERYEEWEGNGFGVRVTPRGAKSFVYLYRFQGKARRMTLGTYADPTPNGTPTISLAQARVKLAQAQEKLANGGDPGAELVMQRRAERIAETVRELVDDCLDKWARPRKRSADEDERILKKDVLPSWGRRKATDIRRRDVIALLDGIVARGAPIAANRTLAVTRRMFNWAIGRDVLDFNPCYGVKPPARENRRDRVLTEKEIRALWKGLDDTTIANPIWLTLKLQLATAQRRGEVAAGRSSDGAK